MDAGQHFNKLTPAEAERLAMLAEECGEVIQIVGKILRHGYDNRHPDGGPTNRDLLDVELLDVGTLMNRMCQEGDIEGYDALDMNINWERKLRFAHHQDKA